jgi:hypothetical protein
MRVKQLVGQNCVICGNRIGSELDARFCTTCRSPVHTACTAERPPADGACPTCRAPAAAVERSNRAAAEEAAVTARSGRGQLGGCILVGGFLMTGSGLMAVARNLDKGTADVLSAAIGVVIGLAVVAFGLVTLGRSAK